MDAHERMVNHLAAAVNAVDVVHTHASSVIITTERVYKLKKPVDFGFLDYSTLERRHHCCLEELRSNRRFAPQLYLGVEPVTGSVDAPMFGGEGEVIDYAVVMHPFNPLDQFDVMAEAKRLEPALMDRLADVIATFHREAEVVAQSSDYGTPPRVLHPMLENFKVFEGFGSAAMQSDLAALKQWTLERFETLTPMLQERREAGYIRGCHGDMHLHNIALFGGQPMLFDAIEFNPYLSHIDVISDLAFLVMDLEFRGMTREANRILTHYLEHNGDYGAVGLLRFYKTYRAMVRAKVERLRAAQCVGTPEYAEAVSVVERYIALAQRYTETPKATLSITYGASASGKSVAALEVAEAFGAVRLRSDVERMRLFDAVTGSGKQQGIYSEDATRKTYDYLATVAREMLMAGVSVVIDATCLKRWQRERFETVAAELGVVYRILEMQSPISLMEARLEQRRAEGRDVSEADRDVLKRQLEEQEALTEAERYHTKNIDGRTLETMRDSVAKGMA